jgi:hypothetical protein
VPPDQHRQGREELEGALSPWAQERLAQLLRAFDTYWTPLVASRVPAPDAAQARRDSAA